MTNNSQNGNANSANTAATNRARLFSVQDRLRSQLTSQKINTVSPKTLRATVEKEQNPDNKFACQFYYLTAARLSEGTNKTYDADFLAGASRPYGTFMKMSFADYETEQGAIAKAWLITLAVAKRGQKITAKKREVADKMTEPLVTEQEIEKALIAYNKLELLQKYKKNEIKIDQLLIAVLLGKVKTKTIAIPLSAEYEPWSYDMLKYLNRKYQGKIPQSIPFDLSRQQLRFIYRETLKEVLPPPDPHSAKNPIRHYRIEHLIDYYHFEPADVTLYTGWTPKTAFAQQGAIGGSDNLDAYYHGQWKKYFPKLLRPISQIAV